MLPSDDFLVQRIRIRNHQISWSESSNHDEFTKNMLWHFKQKCVQQLMHQGVKEKLPSLMCDVATYTYLE